MTVKEAITWLSQLSAGIEWEVDMHYAAAIDVAIEALKAQEKTDTISRQDAIDAILSEPLYKSGMKKRDVDVVVPAIYEKIKSLPSAQPEKVKCKKCRYVYYDKEFGNYWCNRMSGSFKVEEDGYCKWGK